MKQSERLKRNQSIHAYRERTGSTLKEIGHKFGLSGERVRNILIAIGYDGNKSYGTTEERAQKILDFIKSYCEANNQCSPTMSEIANEVYDDPSYKGNIQRQVTQLIDEGYLERSANGRMLMLTRRGHEEKYTRGEK